MKEQWKVIDYSDNQCLISNTGYFKRTENAKPIAGSKDAHGYLRVSFKVKGHVVTKKIHRLVCEAFLIDFDSTQTVNHRDFNKENNCIENLEMASVSENVYHFIKGRKKQNATSNVIGIGYHRGINKWTARGGSNNSRVSLGVFDTESEAIGALDVYNKTGQGACIGKGKSNYGKSKYSEQDNLSALELAKKIGVRKAGVITKMGSTRISMLRKIYKEVNGKFVKEADL